VWLPLSIITAFTFALSSSYSKALARHAHIYVVTWAMMVLGLPLSAALLFYEGVPAVGGGFLKAALISIVLNMVSGTLSVLALRLSPLSLTMPFLAFTPVFMIATGAIVLGESPDTKGLVGIILVALGAYAINLEKLRSGFLAPLKAIVRERGSVLMILVAFIWSITAVYDKVASVESSAAYYTTFFGIAFGILYAPFLVAGWRRTRREPGVTPRLWPRLLLLGVVSVVMILAQFTAIQLTLASYVIAIKRAGLVVSVILGYIFFKERHVRARLAGAFLMTVGVVLISL